MASHELKTFSLQLEEHTENSATLRTDIAHHIGTAKGLGFFVDFKLVYEVHGSFDPSDTSNASLLVIRIVPFPKDIEKQFLWFKVKLSVLSTANPRAADDDDDDDDEENMLQLKSFEPASQGEDFIDVYTTNESRERMAQLSGQVPIAQAATVGGQITSTNKSEFQRTHLLRVKGREEQSHSDLPRNVFNQAAWNIHAANEQQGIGDSFTVAMLIKRPPGTEFQLVTEVDGEVGSFLAGARKFISSNVRGKKPPTQLATFPIDFSNEKVPPGVSAKDLHRASTDNVMRDIEDIGLHLPEKAAPMRFRPGESTGTRSAQVTDVCSAPVSTASLGPDSETTTNYEERCATTRVSAEVPRSATPLIDSALADNAPATSVSHQDQLAVPSPAASSPDTVVVDLLTGITQQLQQLTVGMQQTHGQSTDSNRGSMARLRRHRQIAALYERLAELHREEAKEYFLPDERGFAAQYGKD